MIAFRYYFPNNQDRYQNPTVFYDRHVLTTHLSPDSRTCAQATR